jgi:hypothetical protein
VKGVATVMIDLSKVRVILAEVGSLVEDLDGVDLDERTAVVEQSAGDARRERARQSQALNLLSDRLELAATMVRVQYWNARGHGDPTVDGDHSDGPDGHHTH